MAWLHILFLMESTCFQLIVLKNLRRFINGIPFRYPKPRKRYLPRNFIPQPCKMNHSHKICWTNSSSFISKQLLRKSLPRTNTYYWQISKDLSQTGFIWNVFQIILVCSLARWDIHIKDVERHVPLRQNSSWRNHF